MATEEGNNNPSAMEEKSSEKPNAKSPRKEVPGNFSYTNTPGRFKDTLQELYLQKDRQHLIEILSKQFLELKVEPFRGILQY